MDILAWFQDSVLGNTLMVVFMVAFIGYLVGSIKIRGVELGTAGVLLVALVFGHFGFKVPDLVRELGLICFVTSVGFIAGPKFFRNFKINAKSYILYPAGIYYYRCWSSDNSCDYRDRRCSVRYQRRYDVGSSDKYAGACGSD